MNLAAEIFVLVVLPISFVYFACRNEAVYRFRMKINNEDWQAFEKFHKEMWEKITVDNYDGPRVKQAYEDFDRKRRYAKLPTYDQMMFRFWVWDFDKFFKSENDRTT